MSWVLTLQSVRKRFYLILQLTPATKRAKLRVYSHTALIRAYLAVKEDVFQYIGQLENMMFL